MPCLESLSFWSCQLLSAVIDLGRRPSVLLCRTYLICRCFAVCALICPRSWLLILGLQLSRWFTQGRRLSSCTYDSTVPLYCPCSPALSQCRIVWRPIKSRHLAPVRPISTMQSQQTTASTPMISHPRPSLGLSSSAPRLEYPLWAPCDAVSRGAHRLSASTCSCSPARCWTRVGRVFMRERLDRRLSLRFQLSTVRRHQGLLVALSIGLCHPWCPGFSLIWVQFLCLREKMLQKRKLQMCLESVRSVLCHCLLLNQKDHQFVSCRSLSCWIDERICFEAFLQC